MITGFFLTIVFYVASAVLGILPIDQGALPAQFTSSITLIVGYINAWSWLFPIQQMLIVVAFMFAFYGYLMAFRIGVWFLKLIRPH